MISLVLPTVDEFVLLGGIIRLLLPNWSFDLLVELLDTFNLTQMVEQYMHEISDHQLVYCSVKAKMVRKGVQVPQSV